MKLSQQEKDLGQLAAQTVARAGGFLSFADYDVAMRKVQYFAPQNWCAGWGLSRVDKKSNDDKFCAFAACFMGLLIQKNGGYYAPPKE